MSGIDLLGATLLHFFWQGILIAAVYAAARRCVSRPQFRYALACAALAAMAAAPAVTWIVLRPASPQTIAAASSLAAPHAAIDAGIRTDLPNFFLAGYERVPPAWLSWVAAAWMLGVVFFCLRLLGGWTIAERLRRRQVWPASRQWQEAFDRLRMRLRVSRPVRLLVSGIVHAPAVVGLLRPVVLVPAGALAGLPPEQMEAVLLHELAHIRRSDNLVNALQSVVETLLFYHPAVWWVSGHMRSEREVCCDDAAIAVTGDAQSYARALAEIGSSAHAQYQAAVAANGGSLANRIARLLGVKRPVSRASSPALVATAAALVAIAVMAAFAQTGQPQFEVASIKPNDSDKGTSHYSHFSSDSNEGTLVATNELARDFIMEAYAPPGRQLQNDELIGGPNWINSKRYDVNAKIGDSTLQAWLKLPEDEREEQMKITERNLLAERFKLIVATEKKDETVYSLVVAKGGPKLTPATPLAPGEPPPPDRKMPGAISFYSRGTTMDRFAYGLSRMPVFSDGIMLNETGLAGDYEIFLYWGAGNDTTLPSIFTALQEQLGLRIESKKAPSTPSSSSTSTNQHRIDYNRGA